MPLISDLHPCIGEHALNNITMKNRYPLPLVLADLEQVREAIIVITLDLRSACNLIQIREGDTWRMAFVTTSRHYEFLVIPYGLANAPAVFQSFMNEVFWDMFIYSPDHLSHQFHVTQVLNDCRNTLCLPRHLQTT